MLCEEYKKIVQTIKNPAKKAYFTKMIENEYSIKCNNFNPQKDSPNLFMNKLEFRMKHYNDELFKDDFKLDA